MPTYEYRCLKCGKSFEEFQPITAKPLKKCRFCSGRVERLIGTGGGFILKGSGFYSNDYRKKQPTEKPASCPADNNTKCAGCQCPQTDSK